MGFPRWAFEYVCGFLVCCAIAEGLHVDKATKPHIPHQEFFPVSTSNLTYTVSATTANGLSFASGDRIG